MRVMVVYAHPVEASFNAAIHKVVDFVAAAAQGLDDDLVDRGENFQIGRAHV